MNRRIYQKQWEVPSDTNSEKVYKVSLKWVGEYVCSCPHNIFRKLTCRHIQHVLAFEVARKEAEEKAREAKRFGIEVIA